MEKLLNQSAPRSTADMVFDLLYAEIVNLELLPGAKISEADVGRRFGVSRQPVRDAFNRLGNLDLLEVRPQRATVVRRFSLEEIENTRFLRLSVELEVIKRACELWDADKTTMLQAAIAAQKAALDRGDMEQFHALDLNFHQKICESIGQPMAFDLIKQCKQKVERLCMLSLEHDKEGAEILADHVAIAEALEVKSIEDARALVRHHLSRLDETIVDIHKSHAEYFEPS